MAFNKGYELKKFEAHWEKLRIEYAEAGMADDAIQKMYDYDRQQFNSERTCIERTQELSNSSFECSEDETSPLMQKYMEATTIVDTYHETKSSFAWIGEIEDERLLTALEHLKKRIWKLSRCTPTKDIVLLNYRKSIELLTKTLVSELHESLNF